MRPYGSAARFRLEGGREPRPIAARRWVRVAAAAAVVVAALWAVPKVFRTAVPGGVDQSGRIDILNAFQLARRVARSERLDATWDVTGDGVVDGVDVDAIAQRAVALDGASLVEEAQGGRR